MRDIADHLSHIHRTVAARTGDGSGEQVAVEIRRRYDAEPADVWDAITDPERLVRWFLPVKGDLREGGSFQLEGNAGGDILACEPPSRLRVTYGMATSIVELRLIPDGDGTIFELDHTVPIEMAGSGAGALWVGPGWDGAVVALGLYLQGEAPEDPVAAANSLEAQELGRQSAHLWAAAVETSGTATAEQVAEATAQALAQFAPDLTGDGSAE